MIAPARGSGPPVDIPEPFLEVLTPFVILATVEYRFAVVFTGEVFGSLIRPVETGFFIAKLGGSGKGRVAEAMLTELNRFMGEVFTLALPCGIVLIALDAGILKPVINS